jgi:levansucrase
MLKSRRIPDAHTVVAGTVPACSIWSDEHAAQISMQALPEIATIFDGDAPAILPDMALWDIWPIQLDNGLVAEIAGGSLWVVLSAPRKDDPNLRHDEARMRLLHYINGGWIDCGNLLPDGFAPGSREWSGSSRFDPVTGEITLWFTAAGRRELDAPSFEQRLFHATGSIDLKDDHPIINEWQRLSQSVLNDGSNYADLIVNPGIPGRIKGFRDPYWFRNPADGLGYLLFTGSKSADASQSDYDGVIGIALAQESNGDGGYDLLPPIVDADGLCNELERPHVFVHDGLYYLFWSSQSQVFAPDAPAAPTGLYGMVAPTLFGPYEPLNGSGLVLSNPIAEPRQCYAWQVIPAAGPELDVIGFVDYWGVNGRDLESDPALKAAVFGGTVAPMMKIILEGANTRIVAETA